MSKDEVLLSKYKKAFVRYAEFFGVKNYEIFFLLDKDDAGRGRIEVNYQDKMANVCLCNGAAFMGNKAREAQLTELIALLMAGSEE